MKWRVAAEEAIEMRILIDGVVFENNHQRGIQRIFRDVLPRIAQTYPVDIFLSRPAATELPTKCAVTYRREYFPTSRRNFPMRAWRKTQRRIAPTLFHGHSLFHSTYFTRSPEPDLPEVVTVYDMIPEHFESRYRQWGQVHIENKRLCMEAARRIICISHATAADVAKFYPQFASKLCVTYLGAEHLAPADAPTDVGVSAATPPYVLQIGDRHTYKNFGVLLRAMSEPAWPADLQLVVAGPNPTLEEIDMVQKANLGSRVRFEGPVTDKELAALFNRAKIFVFPSLYEGFGFPLIEAQMFGIPVLCSDIPVFREIGGNSVFYFDPNDSASLAAAASTLLSAEVEIYIAAGLKNVRRFRWDECARQTLEIYQAVANEAAKN